ncbi:MAG: hypothetical protein KGD63_02760 [Candidatus Lokiarchaeota archaeon]|nr:hypothetical protein [Candidatus Lokiarchaeota archaeon]
MTKIFNIKEEKILHNIVKEYTKKKPIIEIKNLIDFISIRLKLNPNFNRNKIELILKKFFKNQTILIGKKLIKEDILKIPIRNEINQLILQNPGININQIMNELNLGANRALWHLKILISFKFIRSVKYESQKNFFVYETNSDSDIMFIYLRNKKVKSILNYLKNQNQPVRPTVLSELLSMHYNTIKKYLDMLVELNLINMVNGDKKKRYIFNFKMDKKVLIHLNSL